MRFQLAPWAIALGSVIVVSAPALAQDNRAARLPKNDAKQPTVDLGVLAPREPTSSPRPRSTGK